ncbi:MAG: pyridoxine 5'-phosphate synthase [Candidatus Omnitrophica bacterium]|nr:pyridoxine 5'-phosphate synthase [Candidatus Omnitrophota bacterium]
MPKLGVNIDHVATLRQQRKPSQLDLILAAKLCELSGADSIVVHLREDRRHIQEADVRALRSSVNTKLNLEMSVAEEIVRLACSFKPDQATLVPERRQELTTEGGLDVIKLKKKIEGSVKKLKKQGIDVSLFIEPDLKQIRAAKDAGVSIIELHTGAYANSDSLAKIKKNLLKIKEATSYACGLGLIVNAGHGLDYNNVCAIAGLSHIYELNIGYSIVCHAVFVGLEQAVRQMKKLVDIQL